VTMAERSDPPRVLIIDDAASTRLLLKSALPFHGLEITSEASSAAEGLSIVKEEHPDVIILDVSMPEESGIEALPKLKEESPDSKVIMYSANDEETSREAALTGGADAYIDKMSAISDVVIAINEVLGRPNPEDE